MGFDLTWVAGDVEPGWADERPLTLVGGLGIDAGFPPDPDELAAALEDADLVVQACLWVAVAFTLVTGAQYLLDGGRATSATGSKSA